MGKLGHHISVQCKQWRLAPLSNNYVTCYWYKSTWGLFNNFCCRKSNLSLTLCTTIQVILRILESRISSSYGGFSLFGHKNVAFVYFLVLCPFKIVIEPDLFSLPPGCKICSPLVCKNVFPPIAQKVFASQPQTQKMHYMNYGSGITLATFQVLQQLHSMFIPLIIGGFLFRHLKNISLSF